MSPKAKAVATPRGKRSKKADATPPVAPGTRAKPRANTPPPKRDGAVLGPLLALLCPWQVKWIQDRSRFKKLEKSRRVGGTWIQALEDVLDAAETEGLDIWFTSADQSSGTEYIQYVKEWSAALPLLIQIAEIDSVAQSSLVDLEFETKEVLAVADEDEATATVVRFHNGSRITALSSSPSRLRSKGGKLVIDEFAHHKRDRDLWKAGQPVALRGHSIRVLSTHNGRSCLFYKLGTGSGAKAKGLWSVHTVTLEKALDEGMLDQVKGYATSPEEREQFRAECEASCATYEDYLEEFMCVAQDEGHAYIAYSLIDSVEREGILDVDGGGPEYIGFDVARHRDLSVVYRGEICGSTLHVREIVVMEKTKFAVQRAVLYEMLRRPRVVRCLIDATGLGEQIAEEATDAFGEFRVQGIKFTPAVKDGLATRLRQEFEDSATLIPSGDDIQRESLHSVRRIPGAGNTPRYDASHDDETGHADHFWALALMVSAARTGGQAPADALSNAPSSIVADHSFGALPFSNSHLDSWAAM